MDDARRTQIDNCLIVTSNFVEAADVQDIVRQLGILKIVHARDAATARKYLAQQGPDDRLVIVAYNSTDAEWQEFVAELTATGVLLILIDAPPDIVRAAGAAYLNRPFNDEDLRRAIRALR